MKAAKAMKAATSRALILENRPSARWLDSEAQACQKIMSAQTRAIMSLPDCALWN